MPYPEGVVGATLPNQLTSLFAPTTEELPSSHAAVADAAVVESEQVNFAWLEITGKCQEECGHCYAESGPNGTHGAMASEDWKSIIDQLAERGTGMVQFIGGEPTLHPGLPEYIEHALDKGMVVEVYTNMVHINPGLKGLFEQHKDRVSLATSYYSPDPAVHREITGRHTHNPIRKNIQWATSVGMELRVGIIGVQEGQDIAGARAELIEMDVKSDRIGVDHLRQVGRGVSGEVTPETTSQLCGNCANGVLAVLPDGSVQPCVFSRHTEFRIGNVREQRLAEVLSREQFAGVRRLLREVFEERRITDCNPWDFALSTDGQVVDPMNKCNPDPCVPDAEKCHPKTPSCNPCMPNHTCTPDKRCNPHFD